MRRRVRSDEPPTDEPDDPILTANDRGHAERLHRIVASLLGGRRLKLAPRDAEDREAILLTALLASARHGRQRPSARFRRRLRRLLSQGLPGSGPAVSRRSVLIVGAATAAGIVAGAAAELAVRPPAGGHSPGAGRGLAVIDPSTARWVDVAALADLEELEGARVEAGAVPAYVFRRERSLWAVSAICSHLPCELRWDRERALLICPCHARAFDPSGQPCGSSYPLPPLVRVRTRVVQGRVQVLGT